MTFSNNLDAAAPSTDAVSLPEEGMVGGVYTAGEDGEAILSFDARPGGARKKRSRGIGAATVGVNSGELVGNYTEAGIESVAFRFATDGHLPRAAVVLRTGDGEEWLNGNLNISLVAGEAMLNSLSFERSSGWRKNRLDTDALWAEALTDVKAIGIRVVPLGIEAQVYTISDFMLIGPDGLQIPADLSPLAARLLKRFNRTTIAGAAALAGDSDGDGDGMSDLDETLLDTGYFVAEVVESIEDTVIKWNSIVNATYKVYRAESLTSGFTLAATLTLPGSEIEVIDGEAYWIDATAVGAGPYFYKVVVDITD